MDFERLQELGQSERLRKLENSKKMKKSRLPKREEDYDSTGIPNILYHLTTEENYDKIKSQGIVPHFGNHCKKFLDQLKQHYVVSKLSWGTEETDTRVFLCEYQDIKFFYNCFKDDESLPNVVIQVDISENRKNNTIHCRKPANYYSEYGATTNIQPKQFRNIYKIVVDEDDEFKLIPYTK